MDLQELLAKVPLLLSYPTIILSSNLIVPSHNDLVFRTTVSAAEHDEQRLALFDIDHIIRLILLPTFIASSFNLFAYYFKFVNYSSRRKYYVLFAAIFLVSIITTIFHPIQSTCISLLIIKRLNVATESLPKVAFDFKTLLKTFVPFIVMTLIILRCDSSWDSGVGNMDQLYVRLFSYALLIVILRYGSPLLLSTLSGNASIGSKESGIAQESTGRNKKFPLMVILPILSFTLLYLMIILNNTYNIQLLMVFVFFGCLSIFFLSLRDLFTEDINQEKKIHGEEYCHKFEIDYMISHFWLTRFTILLTGIMAIVVHFLSFNEVTSSIKTDLLSLLFVIMTEYISTSSNAQADSHSHEHSHCHSHSSDSLSVGDESLFRQMALNKETRSIFSFLLLNTAFMFVQLLYSFRSKSLGLLSDSLHMALDCTSLLLGLIAGILTKKPASDKFPFGLNYLGTLAGFTNGVLLLGIVCGIFVEAVGRIFNPIHLHATNELLVVATLGLLVNLVGLFAFDHGAHDHGGTDNENMKGIFLHILADTLGSVGVIISTLLIKLTRWPIFDPIASLLIGSLILLSALPLLKSTSANILLRLDDKKHNVVKSALNQISTTPGITGYTTPRFWPTDSGGSGHSHSHGHTHSQVEDHGHEHHHEQCSEPSSNPTLVGYIHVQYAEGENSTIIKKRIEKIFENVGVKAWVQVEPQTSTCWCRATSMNTVSTTNPSSLPLQPISN
ncbi:msc2p [Saccharomyces arboricola H-6]|uniref:Zinc transporter n=1 Tax=Saccharomyces arboricola (strain H-6 / AS 2.3317 / CBS 10644) TaxID=1160507 RepID=J8Q130_SACAR|nr:msc2p [Saccharomyces arboricola H-6]